MFRRIALVVTLIILLFLPAEPVMSQGEPARISQEQARDIAQKAFNVPDNAQNIQISFREEDYIGRRIWDLNWDLSSFGKFHSISASVDADTGEVVNYSENQEPNFQKMPGGLKSREECKAKAIAVLQELVPQKFSETRERSNPYSSVVYPYGPSGYGFMFERVVKGIPFPENFINITINARTGKVANYYMNWDAGISFPSAEDAITATDAEKIFREKVGLSLAYVNQYNAAMSSFTQKKPVKLYYTLGSNSAFYGGNQPLIDAGSGKIVDLFGRDLNVTQKVYYQYQEEPAQLPLDKLLTMEKAEAVVKKSFPIPTGYKLLTSRYSEGWGGQNGKMWEFQYGTGSYSPEQQLSISVNALTGEISSINYWTGPWSEQQDKPINYDYNRCAQIAKDFLEKVAPQKAEYVYMTAGPVPNVYWVNGKVQTPPSYGFRFIRIVNGVPFPMNSIYIEVDNNTGAVRSYGSMWDYGMTFTDNKPVLTENEAIDELLKNVDFQLTYVRKASEDGILSNEVLLIYQPYKDYPLLVDAKTGEVISEPELQNPVKLDDIMGHWAEMEIRQLAAMGAVAGNNNKFYPDRQITRAEFVTMLVAAKGVGADQDAAQTFSDVPKSMWCFNAVQAAVKAGLVKGTGGKFYPDKVITRQEMVTMIVLAINGAEGLETDDSQMLNRFRDAGKIAAWAEKAVIRALEMGIISGQGDYLKMTAPATRAEAAVMLIRARKNSGAGGSSSYRILYG